MVDYMQYLDSPQNEKKAKYKSNKQSPPVYDPLYDLWKLNPSFRDVNRRWKILRMSSALVIGAVISIHLFLIGFNLFQVVGILIFLTLMLLMAFQDQFFRLNTILSTRSFDPFRDKLIWQLESDDHSIFMTNKTDLLTVGLRIFQVEVLPENVSASVKHFLRAMAEAHESINYQVIHHPILHENASKLPSCRTFLYFSVSDRIFGALNPSKVSKLIESLEMRVATIRSNFIADFHHFKIKLLATNHALQALREIFLKLPTKPTGDNVLNVESTKLANTNMLFPAVLKTIVTLIMTILVGWLVSDAWNNPLITMFASSGTCLTIILSCWRGLRFSFSTKRVLDSPRVVLHDLFSDVTFYQFRKASDTIFFQVGDTIMGAMKALNVIQIPHPLYTNETTSKLYHSLIGQRVSFSTNVIAVPQQFDQFFKKGLKKLKLQARINLTKKARSTHNRKIWLVQRAGMWNAEFLLTSQVYRTNRDVTSELLQDMERELHSKITKFRILFQQEYSQCELVSLKNRLMESALMMTVLKTRIYRFGGNHLHYLLMQGVDLYPFISIDNSFKKGIETRIAAEFNSPLQLENDINVGCTVNTEFLEQEVSSGFTLDQAKNLLILNGTQYSREQVSLLLARQLIEKGHTIIYFDFTGNASKLLSLLEETQYKKEILHYKLGKTLTIDPIHSEINNDSNNLQFLNLMLDVYAMSFKKDEHAIAMFKNSVSQISNAGKEDMPLDFPTISLFVDNQQEWKKSPAVSSILSTLEDFTVQDSTYLYSQDDVKGKRMTVLDFLTTRKSIILDVSSTRDLEKQCFFTWLIIAKFIHYQSQNGAFSPKYFIIPHIDMIFDHYFLEKKMKHGKISKLISPLLQSGNGFICTASQAHFLHSHVYSMFQNYIAFKSTDKRDTAVIKNVLNLEELHGQGYYSKTRNEAYQVRYLMTMRENEALMKRTDIYQPFPVEFDFIPIDATPVLRWEQIIRHMQSQGFDIADSERKIFESAQKTVLEKDFGRYSFLIPEIITFLEGLQTVHQIGNLYRSKIAEELKHSVYPKLSSITKDKRHLRHLRDEVLSILFSQGYLMESHPRHASGRQSIRTSYQVSPKFQRVLDDYYEAKKGLSTNVEFEVVAQETNDVSEYALLNEGSDPREKSTSSPQFPIDQVKAILNRLNIDILQWNLFQMHRTIARGEHEQAARIGKELAEMFISNLQAEVERLIGLDFTSREEFLSRLASLEGFPLTNTDLLSYLQAVEDQEDSERLYETHKIVSVQIDFYLRRGDAQ